MTFPATPNEKGISAFMVCAEAAPAIAVIAAAANTK
jgi:hypothetical protein